jgi:purine-nucleoside phosphorylase
MGDPSDFGAEVPAAAELLRSRLGPPDLGVLLGSGFARFGAALGCGAPVPGIPGFPPCAVDGHAGGVAAASVGSKRIWVFSGRLHLYEGHDARRVAVPVALLAAAGARGALLTCAAGGLLGDDRPGDFALITDHLNLTGADPLRAVPFERRDPRFLDLQGTYDPMFQEGWRRAARNGGVRLRGGILASLPGPCYETPAEVGMLRVLGADLVSMSTAPEAIAARYLGLRVAAVACIANAGAGIRDRAPIGHRGVLETVDAAVERGGRFLADGIREMCPS